MPRICSFFASKCEPTGTFQVVAETRAFLIQEGIDLSGDQETKTKKALQFFSKQLMSAAGETVGPVRL